MIGIRHLDWMEFIWTSDLPSNARLLAAYLSRYMNKDKDHAFPALKRIQEETNLGHATVLKYLNVLEGGGWLARKQGGGRNNVTYYYVAFPSQIEAAIKQVGSRPLNNKQVGSCDKQVGWCAETGREPTMNQQVINKESPSYKSENKVSTRCPTSEIVNLYHQTLPTLPQCKKITTARAASIRQRHMQDMEGDLESWENYFKFISQSDFLMGRIPASNGRNRPFVATLDWLCKAENFAKLYEGKYHG